MQKSREKVKEEDNIGQNRLRALSEKAFRHLPNLICRTRSFITKDIRDILDREIV